MAKKDPVQFCSSREGQGFKITIGRNEDGSNRQIEFPADGSPLTVPDSLVDMFDNLAGFVERYKKGPATQAAAQAPSTT